MEIPFSRRASLRYGSWRERVAIALVLTLSVAAAFPLFRNGTSQAFDTPIHLARLGSLDLALRQSEWYPRWLPNLLLGHGYPLFNYYAPAPYYVAAALLRLGANAANAYAFSYAIFLAMAGVGMYRWARDLYESESAAVLAAATYLFTPYLMLNTYVRGSFAETCAQALLPWIFWAFRRVMVAERPARHVPLAAVALGALAISHNITLLLTPPVLVAYLLVLGFSSGFARAHVQAATASLLLAMGASAFFWLPLLLERDLVGDVAYLIARFGYLPGNVWQWDNFLHGSLPYVYNDNDAPGPVQLSTVQVVLAALAFPLALHWARGHGTRRNELVMLLLTLVVAGLCVGAWALPIWQSNHILTIVQFPWRLLVIMSLPLALAAGGFAVAFRQQWVNVGIVVIVGAVVVWAHYPRLSLISFFDRSTLAIGPDHVAQIEQYKGAVEGGERTSSVQEFKPRWVSLSLLLDESTVTPPVNELPETGIEVVAANAWHKEVVVNSTQPTQLRFNQFYFPGWRVQNQYGLSASHPSTNLGLLSVDLATGEDHITIEWRGTRVERASVWLTLVALALLVAWCWVNGLRRDWLVVSVMSLVLALVAAFSRPEPQPVQQPTQELAAAGIELSGFRHEQRVADALDLYPLWFVDSPLPEQLEMHWQLVDTAGDIVVDWMGKPFHNSYSAGNFPLQTVVEDAYHLALPALAAGDYTLRGQLVLEGDPLSPLAEVGTVTLVAPAPPLPTPAYPQTVRFEEGIRLDGYDVLLPDWLGRRAVSSSLPVVASGGTLQVRLWWRADAPTEENFHGFVHLVDSSGQPVEQVDQLPGPLFQPPMLWNAQRPAPDVYDLDVPEDAGSGIYFPWVGLYRFPSQNRLMIMAGTENGEEREHVQLNPVKVVNWGIRAQPDTQVAVRLGDFAQWIGYDLQIPGPSLQPGQSVNLTLYYEGVSPSETSYTRFVHAVHSSAGLVTQADAVPQGGANPTWSWQHGEIIVDPLTVTFPPDAPAGEYTLFLGFYAPEQGGVRLPLASDEDRDIVNGDAALITQLTVE